MLGKVKIVIIAPFVGILIIGSLCFFTNSISDQRTSHLSTLNSLNIVKDSSDLLLELLKAEPVLYKNILDSIEEFEVQIIYTQINRDANQKPAFKQYSLNVNDNVYFNPASLVKLPVMLMALDKLNKLNVEGLTINTRMAIDSAYACQERVIKDTIAPEIDPSIAHYCKKIMLVSDNDGYNRLYEFLGQNYINHKLWDMCYKKSLIIQRFNYCSYENNRYTNPLKFFDSKGNVVYSQPLIINQESYKNPLGEIKKGIGFYNGRNQLIEKPKDFTYSNNFPLQELHDMFLSLLFPESFPENKRFRLTTDDRAFLFRYMAMHPKDSEYKYFQNSTLFPDNFKKYFLWGSTHKKITNTTIKTINLPGQSFGYLSDCAYIVDFEKNIEFVLLAVIYTNQSGIFNLPYYRYNTVGFPFLENLGWTLYNYETKRYKKYKPDLSTLQAIIY
jgi:hypothetical protein